MTKLYFYKNAENTWSFYRSYGNGTMFYGILPEPHMYDELKEKIKRSFSSANFSDDWNSDPKCWFTDEIEECDFKNWISNGVTI